MTMLDTFALETELDDRRQQVIQITGQQPQNIVKLQLDFLRENGILVDLSITGTGMFQRTPNWVELGIADWTEDERTKQFTRGTKFLYPEEKIRAIKSVESRLRQNLDRYSREVTGFKPYRWIPYTAYADWRLKHDQIVGDGEALKADLIRNRDLYVDQIAATYTEVAEAAWIAATSGEDASGNRVQQYAYVQVYDKKRHETRTLDHEQFVSFVVEMTIAQIPTVEEIKAKLRWDYTTALVYGEQDIAADQARAEAIREQIALQKMVTRAEAEKLSLENQQLAEQIRAEAWAIQERQRAMEAEREAKIQAMRQAEYEHNVQQLKETISPFAEVYRQALTQFIDHAKDMLESVRKNGHVRGKVAERGRGLLELYQLMVLPGMGSEKMETYLRELKSLLPKDAETRSPDEIAAKLQDIINLEAEIAEDLQAGPSVFSFLEF
jgi:hypothetical protein